MKESAFQSEPRVSESLVRHTSTSPADKAKVTISDGKVADEEKPKKRSLCRTVEGCREELQNQVGAGPGQSAHGRAVLPARLVAPVVGVGWYSSFSEFTGFHSVNMSRCVSVTSS